MYLNAGGEWARIRETIFRA